MDLEQLYINFELCTYHKEKEFIGFLFPLLDIVEFFPIDNGGGMDPDKVRHCMSLGYSAKSKIVDTIGQCKSPSSLTRPPQNVLVLLDLLPKVMS